MKVPAWMFLLLLPLLIAAKCSDCHPSREPELKVIFYQNETEVYPAFVRVYGINGPVPKRNNHYYLPVSLHADSVRYIFENQTQIDTLTIRYSRKFYFDSERCGYVAELRGGYADTMDTGNTFKQVEVVFDEWDGFPSFRKNIYEVSITL